MLTKQESVIGRDHQGSIPPQIQFVELVQQSAQLKIAMGQGRGIIGPQFRDFVRVFGAGTVGREIQDGAIVIARIALAETFRYIERLMRIEGFYLQKPIVRVSVTIKELQPQ